MYAPPVVIRYYSANPKDGSGVVLPAQPVQKQTVPLPSTDAKLQSPYQPPFQSIIRPPLLPINRKSFQPPFQAIFQPSNVRCETSKTSSIAQQTPLKEDKDDTAAFTIRAIEQRSSFLSSSSAGGYQTAPSTLDGVPTYDPDIPSSGILLTSDASGILPISDASGILSTSDASGILSTSDASGILPTSDVSGILSTSDASGILHTSALAVKTPATVVYDENTFTKITLPNGSTKLQKKTVTVQCNAMYLSGPRRGQLFNSLKHCCQVNVVYVKLKFHKHNVAIIVDFLYFKVNQ